jgi:hypothetical protein
MNVANMTPQPGLCSTHFCLANTSSSGGEYLVYAPSGGSFTVNLSATPQNMNVEWFNPATGTATPAGTVTGGSSQTFTPPFGGDAILYLVAAPVSGNVPSKAAAAIAWAGTGQQRPAMPPRSLFPAR